MLGELVKQPARRCITSLAKATAASRTEPVSALTRVLPTTRQAPISLVSTRSEHLGSQAASAFKSSI
jgi:hypothetical protein